MPKASFYFIGFPGQVIFIISWCQYRQIFVFYSFEQGMWDHLHVRNQDQVCYCRWDRSSCLIEMMELHQNSNIRSCWSHNNHIADIISCLCCQALRLSILEDHQILLSMHNQDSSRSCLWDLQFRIYTHQKSDDLIHLLYQKTANLSYFILLKHTSRQLHSSKTKGFFF